MTIAAHIYNNEVDAREDVKLLDEAMGYPVSQNAQTIGYTTCYPYPEGWYIRSDAYTAFYLGTPVLIELLNSIP